MNETILITTNSPEVQIYEHECFGFEVASCQAIDKTECPNDYCLLNDSLTNIENSFSIAFVRKDNDKNNSKLDELFYKYNSLKNDYMLAGDNVKDLFQEKLIRKNYIIGILLLCFIIGIKFIIKANRFSSAYGKWKNKQIEIKRKAILEEMNKTLAEAKSISGFKGSLERKYEGTYGKFQGSEINGNIQADKQSSNILIENKSSKMPLKLWLFSSLALFGIVTNYIICFAVWGNKSAPLQYMFVYGLAGYIAGHIFTCGFGIAFIICSIFGIKQIKGGNKSGKLISSLIVGSIFVLAAFIMFFVALSYIGK